MHQYLYFTVFVMFTFIGIQQLVFRKKLQLNYFLSILFLAGAYNMLYFWLFRMGLLSSLPYLINTEISAAFLIGPCLYLYFNSLFGRFGIPSRSLLIHALPFIVSLTMITTLNLLDESIRNQFIEPASLMPDYSQNKIIFILNTICDLSIAVYFVVTSFRTISILRNKKITRETRAVIFFLVSFSISAILLITASFLQNTLLLQISIVFLSLLPLFFIFFSFRHPDYAIKVIRETRNYGNGKVKELTQNINLIKTDLNHLMTEKKIYRQPDLSLKSLSEMLSIHSHELSYILNSEINMNFNSYINSFRIGEAKIQLLEQGSKSITEIAFDVGFNSTSSFYRYFLKDAGVSPKDFQKAFGRGL